MLYINNFNFFVFEIYFLLSFLFLIVLCVIFFLFYNKKFNYVKLMKVFFSILFLFSYFLLKKQPIINLYLFNFYFVFEKSLWFIYIYFIFFASLILFLSLSLITKDLIYEYEFFLLIFLAVIGLFVTLFSNNFVTLYFGLELQGLSFYLLAGYKKFSKESTEAGLKYFILGSFASSLILLGVALIYGVSGTINFEDLGFLLLHFELIDFFYDWPVTEDMDLFDRFPFQYVLNLGFIFLLSGFLFKLGVFPFHMWIPDVYQGSMTLVTMLFATLPKIVIVTILIKFSFVWGLFYYISWHYLFVILGFLSVVVGSVGALYQTNIKRMLGYSAISHIGFVIAGIGVGTTNGFTSVFFYAVIYMLLSIVLFLCVLSSRSANSVINSHNAELLNLEDFVLILRANPFLGYSYAMGLFSIAGVPPLAGFFNKFLVLLELVYSGLFFFSLTVALTTLVSTFYYLRLIKILYFEKPFRWDLLQSIYSMPALILSFSSLCNIGFFYFFNFFFLLAQVTVVSLVK